MSPTDRPGYVRVRGKRLFYRRFGSRGRNTVLVLHGGPGLSHDYLTPLADLAVSGFDVVLYDQLGCGRSERPASYRDYTIQAAADDADELRRRMKLGPVHLYGHSYGGALALEVALRHPGALRSMIVAGGFASVDSLWRGLRRRVSQLSGPNRRALIREDRTGISTRASERASEEFRRRFSERMENRPYEVWKTLRLVNRRMMRAMGFAGPHLLRDGYRHGTLAGWDVRESLSRIRGPVLVTGGEYDHVVPACAREIHRGIPGSRLIIGRGEGHLPFLEHRDRYISTVRGFLDAVG